MITEIRVYSTIIPVLRLKFGRTLFHQSILSESKLEFTTKLYSESILCIQLQCGERDELAANHDVHLKTVSSLIAHMYNKYPH